jgi:hypothetical protein
MVVGGIGLVMAMSSIMSRGDAAEWSAEPSVTLRGDYNTNLTLTALPHEAVWGLWASPGVKFAGSTENLEVSGRAASDFVQYYGGSNRTLTNLYFPLSVKYTTARETFSFDGGFTRDNTLMGEARQTGVVLNFTQRNLLSLGPSWTHALTEQLSAKAGYQYTNTTYEDGLRLGLVNYTVNTGSGGLQYQPTEMDQVNVTGSYTNFHAPQSNDLTSEIYSGQLSLTHNFTETITGTLGGGPTYVQSAINAGSTRLSDHRTLGIGSANLRKAWDDAFIQIEASRQINPSGFGLLVQTDKIGATLSKDFTEQWTVSISAFQLWASALSSNAAQVKNFPENRYVNVNPQVTWKFSQWGQVAFMYTYVNRHVEVSSNSTSFANIASVVLTYTPPKLTVGR